jgi:molecular chaperone GrpE
MAMGSEHQEDHGLDKVQEPIEESEFVRSENETGAEVQEGAQSEASVSVSLEELEKLQKELEEARTKANEYLDGWQRARAEFANYKKRVDRDQAQTSQVATGNVVRRFLEVLDDLERALKNRPEEGEGAVWSEGIELIYRKLLNMLENEGVKPMEIKHDFFDPNLHEAVVSEENNEFESGQIIDVIRQGYVLGDRVLRPAMVRVAR